jgi:hypothetical protein
MSDGRGCCAACRQYFPISEMDIVDYGTGYRCLRCSEGVKAAEATVDAIDAARARESQLISRSRWGLFGWVMSWFD